METTTNTTSNTEKPTFARFAGGPAVAVGDLWEELQKRNAAPLLRRSAWLRGVGEYAEELLEELIDAIYYEEEHGKANGQPVEVEDVEKWMMNGAPSWRDYSWGGCSLIYDSDICERLATPSEQKRTRNGERNPNSREQWLDTQTRALYQAAQRVRFAIREAERKAKEA